MKTFAHKKPCVRKLIAVLFLIAPKLETTEIFPAESKNKQTMEHSYNRTPSQPYKIIAVDHHAWLIIWLLGTITQVFLLEEQALYAPCHLPRPSID